MRANCFLLAKQSGPPYRAIRRGCRPMLPGQGFSNPWFPIRREAWIGVMTLDLGGLAPPKLLDGLCLRLELPNLAWPFCLNFWEGERIGT